MPNSHIQSIKQIARQVKYRELTNYIGQAIVINGIDTIEVDLKQQLKSVLINESIIQPKEQKYFERALAKYGLIDVGFEVPNAVLDDNYRNGISLLRDVNFFPKIPSPDEFESYNDAISVYEPFLQDMIDELSLSKTFLLLFLKVPVKVSPKLHLVPDLLPANFVIRDACLTNISSIWINKHFYF